MKLNENKTKVQTIGKEKRKLQIKIDKTDLEQVDTYPYLGITIEESGNQEIEINKRIENALKMFYAMNKTFIQKKKYLSTQKQPSSNRYISRYLRTDARRGY